MRWINAAVFESRIPSPENRVPRWEAGRVGRAGVVPSVRCASLRNAARRTRPVFGRYSRTGLGLALLTTMETTRGALGPSSPVFTGSARMGRRRPMDPAVSCPAGRMPSPFASLFGEGTSAEHPTPRTSSTMTLSEFPLHHRSDDSRAGRCSDLPKVRSTSKSSRVRAEPLYVSSGAVGLILFEALFALGFCSETWGIEWASILVSVTLGGPR